MPQSIPQGLTPEHVLKALADLDTGAEHLFGQYTGYELLYKGRPYAPKAVIGLDTPGAAPFAPTSSAAGRRPGRPTTSCACWVSPWS